MSPALRELSFSGERAALKKVSRYADNTIESHRALTMSMKLSAELFNEIVSSLKSDGTCSHGHEKRAHARVGLRCALEVSPCTFTAKKQKPVITHVHDLSINGVGLVSPVRLEENSEFVARFPRDNQSPVPVLYKVRHCRKISSDLHSVGAMFQRVLPDAAGEIATIGRKKLVAKKADVPKPETDTGGVTAA